ncbi:HipA domain-containing protein [uncultured Herbaspirillum sp.]|uniref:HipA domain-containing protein n=1 Tax=uncultured Herbaspirillum sp. TaxID=160236 RepID=UPI00258A787B|nr:HipA domain-containing protein [uncultured Herbaspirillum sp.]
MQQLHAWMNGELVGTWSVERQLHRFHYAPQWVRSVHFRPLSLSLPLTASGELRGDAVRHYFDNLLPDNADIRERLRQRYRLASIEVFDLLQALGRDCVGALQLLPPGQEPQGWRSIQVERLDESAVEQLLLALPLSSPPASQQEEALRISIAGAQEKTALTWHRGKWCRPLGATPTTHIIKLPLGLIGGVMQRVDAGDSVYNEWLCSRILAALGLPVAPARVEHFGRHTVLAVERFDRVKMKEGWIARLPQEDFCQAFGLPPTLKYESQGGPGLAHCLGLLNASSQGGDKTYFLLAQLAFFLLAATDGHAKNFSLHLHAGGRYEMTPLYDVLSMWPYFGKGPNQFRARQTGPAMILRGRNAHRYFHTIEARHWRQLALQHGGEPVWQAMLALVQGSDAALEVVQAQLPADFPLRTWERISQGVRSHRERFLRGAGQ